MEGEIKLRRKKKDKAEKTRHNRRHHRLRLPVRVVMYRPLFAQRRVRQALLGACEAGELARSRHINQPDIPLLVGCQEEALGVIAALRVHGLAVEPLLCGQVSAVDLIAVGAGRTRDLNGRKVLTEGGEGRAENFKLKHTIHEKKKTNPNSYDLPFE